MGGEGDVQRGRSTLHIVAAFRMCGGDTPNCTLRVQFEAAPPHIQFEATPPHIACGWLDVQFGTSLLHIFMPGEDADGARALRAERVEARY